MGRFWAYAILAGCGFDADVPASPTPTADAARTVMIDAAPDASPAALCTARYGAATEFVLCDATPTACRFYVDSDGATCADVCSGFGGTCKESYDGDCANISTTVRACTSSLGDQVCNCSP